jgi:soluble lytic murein transglycosylase-like protein
MQLMPATAQDLNVSDPFDPKQNVSAGARYLKQLMDRYGGDIERALGAYNAGPSRVDRTGGVPQIRETQNYVWDIVGRLLTL